LSESRKQVDCHQAVAECYGENVSIFSSGADNGDDDARNMLANLVSERLEQINERLTEEFRAFMERNEMNTKLLRIEHLIEEYERRERTTKQIEEEDRRLAQGSAEQASLPEGIKVEDIVKYHAYRVKLEEKQKILAEIASIEAENKMLEVQINEQEAIVEDRVNEIKELDESMAKTADISSFSGS